MILQCVRFVARSRQQFVSAQVVQTSHMHARSCAVNGLNAPRPRISFTRGVAGRGKTSDNEAPTKSPPLCTGTDGAHARGTCARFAAITFIHQANGTRQSDSDMHLVPWLLPLRHKVARLRARVRDRITIAYDANGILIPREHLSSLVTGAFDTDYFLTSGRRSAELIRDLLLKNGTDIARFDSILDFGCGVGRVLRNLPPLTGARLFGCDYNKKLIAWCRKHLPFARFTVNGSEAKLQYDHHSFDFVYAWSVFTHFTEAQHVFWIDELGRILRPGGYLLLTTHGAYFEQYLPEDLKENFQKGELVVERPDRAGQNRCCAYQPEKYVRDKLAQGWDVLDFLEQGAPNQDIYLLRKPLGRQRP